VNTKYEWRDVWVLASIIMAGESEADAFPTYKKKYPMPPELERFRNIYGVIGAGDYIDRGTFLVEELSVGIKNLLDGGYIEIEDGFLKPTRKTNEYFDREQGDRKHVSIRTALDILKQLLEVN
jgi:hypothetical protein